MGGVHSVQRIFSFRGMALNTAVTVPMAGFRLLNTHSWTHRERSVSSVPHMGDDQ